MTIATLAHLYCAPQDVYDWYGVQGAQLLMDDQGQSTGQEIEVTANAVVGATSISITALSSPLLAGSVLEFGGSGMAAIVEVQTTAVGQIGDTTLTVAPLPAQVNQYASATDNGVNVAFGQRLVKGCNYGTSQVQLYCLNRYNDSDLYANAQQNGSVNRWATALACRWVGRRRANGCPKSILDECEEVMEELKGVRLGQLCVDGIGTRTSGWPFISNVTVDHAYDWALIRVEAPLSEGTPTQFAQFIDWNSALLIQV